MFSSSSTLACPSTPCNTKPSLTARIFAAIAVWRSRKKLADLDEDRLDDLGISSKAAQTEANLPIWDVPTHWIK